MEGLVVGSLNDQVIDDVMRFVDVVQRAIPKTSHRWIVFFSCDVIVGLIQQLLGAMKTASASHPRIDWRVVIQILAVVDRSPLNFVDGFVDLVDGVLFLFVHVIGGSQVLQMSAGMPQIGQRVQIGRMPSRFLGNAQRGASGKNKHE